MKLCSEFSRPFIRPLLPPLLLVQTVMLFQLTACVEGDGSGRGDIQPPVARISPEVMSIHGHQRVDNYFWIRDDSRSDPDVLRLLEAENQYTRAMLAHTNGFQNKLFNEIAGRLKADDRSVPVKSKDYLYYREFRQGGEHPVYLRSRVNVKHGEEVLLDVNENAAGLNYYHLGNWSVSPGQDLVAYTEDTLSRREYTLRFKRIASNILLQDSINGISPAIAWAKDNETVFYVKKHPLTLLPYQVYRHRLGQDPSRDQLVYEEKDPAFHTSVYASRSEDYVVILLSSTSSTEIRLIDAGQPLSAPLLFLPREPQHEYRIRHLSDRFYVLTNWKAENFQVMRVNKERIGTKAHWEQVVPHRKDTLIEDIELFENYLVINERSMGLPAIKIMDLNGGELEKIEFPGPAYSVRLHANPEVKTARVRYLYESLKTPQSVYEYDIETRTRALLKRKEVAGNYIPDQYRSERIWIKARDGVKIPVSLVYKKDKFNKGQNPLYLYAYGAYGHSTDPSFQSKRLSLIDRGFIIALVHVRGGSEMGRHWYEAGRLLKKKNTFQDFIDATRALTDLGWGDQDKVFAAGASAGGLLMGVVANDASRLYRGIIARVPFVDVVTTMLDESIPLTTEEFEEWGNPGLEKDYRYILSYSPYDQVSETRYPNMLVTTGLYDSQVQYFEPVKWVSKLRKHNTSHNPILLHIDMNTGHGGASGRYQRFRMDALEYAFILDTIGTYQ